MPRKLTCRVSKDKEEGLVAQETLRDKSILYSRNEKNSGYKELRLWWTNRSQITTRFYKPC